MRHVTAVQLPEDRLPERVWADVADPVEIGEDEEVFRLSLDLRAADFDLLYRYAEYRNVLADETGKRTGRRLTRKSLAESYVAKQTALLREKLEAMVMAIGEIPVVPDAKAPESEKAQARVEMVRYVKRALAWDKK